MMKAITFLGTGSPRETAYVLGDGREHVAPYFGVALAHFYSDLDLFVFVTPEARASHFDTFTALAADTTARVEPVDIPGDGTEEALWQIFEAVINVVDDGDSVVFDITHGFRFMPFLSFLAAAYVRTIKNARLEAVLYGNFEARDQSVTPNRAPVIDMTPFVGLLDWMVAADRFISVGDARDLAAELLAARPPRPAWPAEQDPDQRRASTRLYKAATALEEISDALRLIRPLDALQAAATLQGQLLDATQELQAYARPFRPLARDVMHSYAPLALEDAGSAPIARQLERERELVNWYMKRQQYAQALATAREWLVTWVLAHSGRRDQLDSAARRLVEETMRHDLQVMQRRSADTPPPHYEDFSRIPRYAEAIDLFNRLGDVRNDVMHAGKRRGARQAATVKKNLTRACEDLDSLPLPDA